MILRQLSFKIMPNNLLSIINEKKNKNYEFLSIELFSQKAILVLKKSGECIGFYVIV